VKTTLALALLSSLAAFGQDLDGGPELVPSTGFFAPPAFADAGEAGAVADAGVPEGALSATPARGHPTSGSGSGDPALMIDAASTLSVGGYAELVAGLTQTGPSAPFVATANLRRVSLGVSKRLSPSWRLYLEYELENAITCASCRGLSELEQAYVEWQAVDAIGVRAGLVLTPMGIQQRIHEPTLYNGVNRPLVELAVIPSTWRELAVGVYGSLAGRVRYELYATSAPSPEKLNREGFIDGRAFGSFARFNGPAVEGRVEGEPMRGLTVGASFYGGDMGPNTQTYDENGKRVAVSLPLLSYELDAQFNWRGVRAKGLWVQFFMPNTGALLGAYKADGSPFFSDPAATGVPPRRMQGGYLELSYDVLRFFDAGGMQLYPFARVEVVDTQALVPTGYVPDPRFHLTDWVFGVSFLPHRAVVVKADVTTRNRLQGDDEVLLNLGVGVVF